VWDRETGDEHREPEHTENVSDFSGWSRAAVGAVASATLLAALAGCTHYPQKTHGRYVQTWPKPYTKTTCAEWHDEMSHDEQFIATAEILEAVWGGPLHRRVRLPPDEVMDGYRDDIDDACADPTATLYTIAVDAIERRMPHFILG
jgi:hypothetical protein